MLLPTLHCGQDPAVQRVSRARKRHVCASAVFITAPHGYKATPLKSPKNSADLSGIEADEVCDGATVHFPVKRQQRNDAPLWNAKVTRLLKDTTGLTVKLSAQGREAVSQIELERARLHRVDAAAR